MLFTIGLGLTTVNCKYSDQFSKEVRPNIVMILTDDQGWGDLGFNGNTNVSTPNIDKLAAEGVVFEHFYVSPVCSPTRAEILTGRYHPRTGVYSTSAGGERMDLDEVTIADLLRDTGYQTGAFGKWHNGMQYPYHPNGRGFAEFYGFCSGHWGHYFSPMLEHNGELTRGEGFVIDDFTNRALDFIDQQRDQPFFVYLPFNTPHSPMQVPEDYWEKYENKVLVKRHRASEKEDVHHTRAALAMVENIDWNVGRIMGKLSELALDENTLVIYLSDNGPNGWRWNGGMKGRKGSTDEGGVRSPLVMRWPETIDGGRKIAEIAGAIDFFPTLLDLCGVPLPTKLNLDGRSLSPLVLNTKEKWPERLLFSHWNGRVSARNQKFRLDHEGNLFDLEKDPGQSMPVQKQYPEIFQGLKDSIDHWSATVLAELPADDLRRFPLGHSDYLYTQIPARDGKAHGAIKRSNRWPNCSYFTNWLYVTDSITWPVEVLHDSDYRVTLYYTCSAENTGCVMQLSASGNSISREITEAHDPPLVGMDEDRHPRGESYVKDFRPLDLGVISLAKGPTNLNLRARKIPGKMAIEFRLLMFEKV